MIRNFARRFHTLPLINLSIPILIALIASVSLAQMAGVGNNGLAPASHSQNRLFDSGAMGSDTPPIFLPAVVYEVPGAVYVYSIAVADINGDGRPDLIVDTDNGIRVRPGNGDGTFQPEMSLPYYGYYPVLLVADVNGDGKPDLVLAGGNTLGVLLGNGDGTFHDMVTYAWGGDSASSIAVADFNNDGKPDLVLAGGDTVGVLLGNGDGTFRAPVVYHSVGAHRVTVADVNLDGKPDLLVANWSSATGDDPNGLVGVLLGNGDGTFQPGVTFGSGGYYARAISAQDVNEDGKPDLLVMSDTGVSGSGDSVVGVLLGNGDGTFQPAVSYSPGQGDLHSLAVGDVNGDHNPDLVVTSGNSYMVDGVVSVLLGNGDGTFQAAVNYDSGGYVAEAIALADVNGDARPDLLVVDDSVPYASGRLLGVGVLLNNAGAPHTTTTLISSPNPAVLRQIVTYTATVAAQSGGVPTGTVKFQDGSRTIATVALTGNQAAYSTKYTQYTNPGAHLISATYTGDLNNAGSTGTITEYFPDFSKTTLTTSGSPSSVGQPVTFTAMVTPNDSHIPDGEQVMFYDGTTTLGSVTLTGGVASYTTSSLTAKSHYIQAIYGGDPVILPSTGHLRQVVNKFPTTIAFNSTPNPASYGQPVTFTATVTPTGPYPLTGKVVFKDGTLGIGSVTLSGGVATLTKRRLAPGTHPITAQYLGDAASANSTSSVLDQVVK